MARVKVGFIYRGFMRIAIMQPYFVPYAGYFRLLQGTDLFVVYDCVQFMRRGYVHRNQLPDNNNEATWLTLPLAKAPQDIKIAELNFASDAVDRMQQQRRKFPLFQRPEFLGNEVNSLLADFSRSPVEYIIRSLQWVCAMLDIPCNILRSSELKLSSELKGQDRIIAIADYYGATTYLNAPGGRSLYDEASFKHHKIKLEFLSDYQGSYQSILFRLFNERIDELKKEIILQSQG